MPPLRKAARGKRRWVGVRIDKQNIDQTTMLEQLTSGGGRPRIAWTSDDGCFSILEIRLEKHSKLIELIDRMNHVESITSSGKIRLVKARISQLYRSP